MKTKKIDPVNNAHQYPLLIKSIFQYSTVLEPEREIVYRDISRYNYYEFSRRVQRLANVLEKLGLEGGETIGVVDYDSHRYLECYFAIPMTGNVLHTINWRLSPAQILYTINHTEDSVLFVNSDFLPLIEGFAGQMPHVKKIIVTSDNGKVFSDKIKVTAGYEELMAQVSDQYTFPDFDENSVATTFHTTGTTGNPKAVYFTHRQLVLHTFGLASSFGFTGSAACRINSNDTYMPLTPMFHVHAWGFPYLATMFSFKQVYAGKFDPGMVAKLFREEKPTFSHGVPTILQMILSCPEAQDLDFSSWKVIIGGSALPKVLAKQAIQKNIDLITAYGMSETCPLLTSVYIRQEDKNKSLDWQVEARTRTGVPSVLIDLRVVNEFGDRVIEDDETMGEVVARGPWLTQGYFKDEEKSRELWRDGYLHTGDVATVDHQNSIKITDRIKDVIKTGGEWVSSIELENFIGRHEAVAEVAVVSIPHSKWGERPYALIVLKPGYELSLEGLNGHLQKYIQSGQISKWAVPEQIEFANAIPKTSVGKIDKKAIRMTARIKSGDIVNVRS